MKDRIKGILEKAVIKGRGKNKTIENIDFLVNEIDKSIEAYNLDDVSIVYLAFLRIVEKHGRNESDHGTLVFNWINKNSDKIKSGMKTKMIGDVDRILSQDSPIKRCYYSNLTQCRETLLK